MCGSYKPYTLAPKSIVLHNFYFNALSLSNANNFNIILIVKYDELLWARSILKQEPYIYKNEDICYIVPDFSLSR